MKKILLACVVGAGLLWAAPLEAQLCMGTGGQGCPGGGGGGLASGAAVSGCTIYSTVTINGSGNLACGGTVLLNANSQTVMPLGTSSLPSIAATGGLGTGIYFRTVNLVDITAQTVPVVEVSSAALNVASAAKYCWFPSTFGNAAELCLTKTVAGVMRIADVSGNGWIQDMSGELALAGNYTNATATFSATALSTTVKSGRTYSFLMSLTFADSTAADGAQFDFNGGTAAATDFRVHCSAVNAAGASLVLTNAASTTLTTAVQVALALTTQASIECRGTFVPSGAGTFIVRAAQTAHSTGTLTVHRGSWLHIRDASPL